MSLRSKQKGQKHDLPAPYFIQPSPGASHVSLPEILTPGATVPGPHMKWDRSSVDVSAATRSGAAVSPKQKRQTRSLQPTENTRGSDRTDALWAEMQATLQEVESSASEGTRVFGPEHDRKLAELRAAQIALAQAWARSEADDAIETTFRDHASSTADDDAPPNVKNLPSDPPKPSGGDGTDAAKSTAGGTASGQPQSASGGADRLGAKLDEETEVDILLARQRREANDEYFQRVNNGVLDVVAKLESVAVAMRTVEQETKDMWNENTSLPESTET